MFSPPFFFLYRYHIGCYLQIFDSLYIICASTVTLFFFILLPLNEFLYIDFCPLVLQNSGARLWAFIVATYWVSIVSYLFLWRAYKHVAELRAKALMSPEVRADQFAILVRDIPSVSESQSRKEQIDSYFSAIYPETFYRSMVVTDNKKVIS